MKRLLRISIRILGVAGLGIVGFIAIMWGREWRPERIEILYASSASVGNASPWADSSGAVLRIGDTVRVVSWNIGYAGLGDDMDFFYDGGTRMRTSRTRTEENLRHIIERLRREAADRCRADFILLQEVDTDSRRSYGMNQYDSIRAALAEYFGWQGLNYVCDFVPIPLRAPLGKVRSGVAIFSRWGAERVVRYAYPGGFSFPVRLFNLKRCLLSAEIPVWDSTGNRRVLYLNDTHNTAYDTGGMREQELAFLSAFLTGKAYSLTMGDWNCSPPGYRPSRAALEDEHFRPLSIDREEFPPEMTFVYDSTTPSVRYGYEPYRAGRTTTAILDFALCGPGLEPVSVRTLDWGFENSDHNPVVATFVLR